jgi:ligand-binding SRPBCC domain-containing protein
VIRPQARVLERTNFLSHPIGQVFAFFAEPQNLEKITPPTMRFTILTPLPIEMRQGALIDYRIVLNGIRMLWRTEITEWQPPHRFIDTQLKGPYLQWIHEHSFREVEGGTEMMDRVEYRVPGGPLEPLIHRLYVRPQVERIFDYRESVIAELLASR